VSRLLELPCEALPLLPGESAAAGKAVAAAVNKAVMPTPAMRATGRARNWGDTIVEPPGFGLVDNRCPQG
jgi:hypothetical protein